METLRITSALELPVSELEFRFSRSGGPGGQNVNRRETQVELLFDVAGSPSLGPRQRARLLHKLSSRINAEGVLHIKVSDESSQGRNRQIAIERFQQLAAEALRRPQPRRPTLPSKGVLKRRLEDKKRRSRRKSERSGRLDD